MKTELRKADLKAFLKYFYYVEEMAQAEGYATSARYTNGASRCHERLMEAVK